MAVNKHYLVPVDVYEKVLTKCSEKESMKINQLNYNEGVEKLNVKQDVRADGSFKNSLNFPKKPDQISEEQPLDSNQNTSMPIQNEPLYPSQDRQNTVSLGRNRSTFSRTFQNDDGGNDNNTVLPESRTFAPMQTTMYPSNPAKPQDLDFSENPVSRQSSTRINDDKTAQLTFPQTVIEPNSDSPNQDNLNDSNFNQTLSPTNYDSPRQNTSTPRRLAKGKRRRLERVSAIPKVTFNETNTYAPDMTNQSTRFSILNNTARPAPMQSTMNQTVQISENRSFNGLQLSKLAEKSSENLYRSSAVMSTDSSESDSDMESVTIREILDNSMNSAKSIIESMNTSSGSLSNRTIDNINNTVVAMDETVNNLLNTGNDLQKTGSNEQTKNQVLKAASLILDARKSVQDSVASRINQFENQS